AVKGLAPSRKITPRELVFVIQICIFELFEKLSGCVLRMQGTHSFYPKGGVLCFVDTFVQAESSFLRMSFSGKNPALRVAANRYGNILKPCT
ncbi:hypothetical protein EQG68_13845, partial [Flavobacterium piscinae]